MASYAELKPNLERPFGLRWRTGEVVAGELYVVDRTRSLFSPSNSTLSATAYRLDGDYSWNKQGNTVTISDTSETGIKEWSFEPETDDLWRVVFTLDGDYKAKNELTLRVHDPLDRHDPRRPGDEYAATDWGRYRQSAYL